MKKKHLGLAIGLSLLAGLVHAEQAQPVAKQNEAKSEAMLDKVTVSARRREESLQEVPVSVTAFTPEAIDKLNIQDLSDLDEQVPNLTIYAARGSNSTITAYIRGVGQSDPLWGVDPGVGLYLNDVYIARPQGALLDVFDIERIEVLRGPQGTLYGKNTIGGAIKYISKGLPTETNGSAQITIGSYGQADFKASAGGAFDENGTLRGRIAVASLNRDGYGSNLYLNEDVTDKDTFALRAELGAYIGENFDVQLAFDKVNDNSNPRGAQMLAPNAFGPGLFITPKTAPLEDRYDVRSGMPGVNKTDMQGASLTANYRASEDWSFKYILAKRESDTDTYIDFDTLPQQITDVKAFYDDEQLSQELQAHFDGGGASRGVMGIYWFDGTAGGLVQNIFLKGVWPGFPGLFGDTRGYVDTTSIAAYIDWTYDMSEKWSINGGLRWTQEEKTADVLNRGYTDETYSTVTAVAADFNKSVTFHNLSPKLSLDYQMSDEVMFYGSLSRGFKSGGFNIRATASPISQEPYDDEQIDSIELGSKMAFLDQTLFVNAAYFYNKYEDIQLSIFSSCLIGTVQSFCADFTNAGKATIHGLELEMQWRPGENWFISGNLATLNAQFDEYMYKGVDIADQQEMTNAPDFSGAVNVEYLQPLASGGKLSYRIGYSYQSDVVATTEITKDPITNAVTVPITQDGYGLISAGIIWTTERSWTLSLQGSNLADKEYLTTGYVIPSTGVRTGFYGAPQLFSLSARYDF
jgi:iron complex outermembrane recepter protein